MEYDFLALVDGGSLRNGSAHAQGFGSYHLATRDGQRQTVRLDLGTATNNEAEYRTLIAALRDLISRIQRAGKALWSYSLLIYTDSQLLVGQLTQGWQVKAANLRSLRDEAASLMRTFGRCELLKVPSEEILRVLGH